MFREFWSSHDASMLVVPSSLPIAQYSTAVLLIVESYLASKTSPPHQTIPEVHLPAGVSLRHGDAGGEVVEEAAAVLGVLGGDDEAGSAQGDEVLEGGVEFLADVAGEDGGGVAFPMSEDLEEPPAGGIAERGIDGVGGDDLRRWSRDGGRRCGSTHGLSLPGKPTS